MEEFIELSPLAAICDISVRERFWLFAGDRSPGAAPSLLNLGRGGRRRFDLTGIVERGLEGWAIGVERGRGIGYYREGDWIECREGDWM
jgi:hypothetical protein